MIARIMAIVLLAVTAGAADLCEARIRAWRDANPGVTFASATCGGGTVIEINGSATLAAQANALSDAAVQAAAAAIDAEAAAASAPAPADFPGGIAVPDPARTNIYVALVPIDGDVVPVPAHASPFDAAAFAQRVASNRTVRAELQTAIRQALRRSATNHVQILAIPTNATPTAASFRAAVGELRDANNELRATLRALLDSMSGTNRPSRSEP